LMSAMGRCGRGAGVGALGGTQVPIVVDSGGGRLYVMTRKRGWEAGDGSALCC